MNPKVTKVVGYLLNAFTTKNMVKTPSTWASYGGIVATVMQGPPQSIEDVALQAIFITGSTFLFFFRKPT